MNHQVSFVVNDDTMNLIQELKRRFHVNSNAAVIRRALALAKVATESAGADNTVTIINARDQQSQKVMLAG